MKKILLLCCTLFVAAGSLATAGEDLSQPAEAAVPVLSTSVEAPLSAATQVPDEVQYAAMKDLYYELLNRYNTGEITPEETTKLREMSFSWGFVLPAGLEQLYVPARDANPLDDGGPDCASAVAIGSVPFSDTGSLDGDNDCVSSFSSPSNEKFYSFVPANSGFHQFRARSFTTGVPSVRIMSVACCEGGTSVVQVASSVAGDCNEPTTVVTYGRANLTAGTQYWIHVGTSSSTVSTLAYEFSLDNIQCPPTETTDPHNTCATAQVISCGDSIFGSGAVAATPDWYQVDLADAESLRVFVGGRELGHCLSGIYPAGTAVDGRFTLYDGCGGAVDSIGFDDNSGCSNDAKKSFCLAAGTYFIKVWNTAVADYVMTTSCGPSCDPPVPPENDLCADAIPVAVPSSTNGYTPLGTVDTVPTCATLAPTAAPGVWYSVIGNGFMITADVCVSSFDTKVNVYTGTCEALVCLDADDDDCSTPNGLGSTVTWCSVDGVEYLILVYGHLSAAGTFTLNVTTNGLICACEAIELCGTPTETEPNTCVTPDATELGCDAAIFGLHCPEADSDWFQIRIPANTTMTINVLDGPNCDVTPTTTVINKLKGSSCTSLSTSSTGPRTIYNTGAGGDSLVYLLVYNTAGTRGTYKITTTCAQPVDCQSVAACGAVNEVEPNNACANSANFQALPNCGGIAYGVICADTPPQTTDLDYWTIPAVAAGQILTVTLKEGVDCATLATNFGMRNATTSAGACTTPSGTATNVLTYGGCVPFAGGFLVVSRVAGEVGAYALEVACHEPACPTVIVENQHCSGPCAGTIYDFGPAAVWTDFTLNVPIQYSITDVNVRVDLNHTFDGDLDIYLISPWADSVRLSNRHGGTGENYQVTLFDDEAGSPITAGSPPYNGPFRPDSALSAFDGFNALGTWTLAMSDNVNLDSGFVTCWCLEFQYDRILAAELSSFDATLRDGEVELNWTTASETSNDRFEIERNNVIVARVEATNNAAGSSYSWVDEHVTNGTTYTYRLMAVDVNGTRSELATQSVTPSAGAAVITEYALHQNYPNPFNPETQIVFDLVEAGNVSLRVYNLMGQEVATVINGMKTAGRHTVSFDAASLPSGLYLYKIDANGFTAQKKMLLLK